MQSAINDFDFLMGPWRVRHRRLKERLVACLDWETFEGTCTAQKILGGAGNLDDNSLDLPSGAYQAVSLRTFDSTAGLWSIWWLDGRNPRRLDSPVVGTFNDEVGLFLANDVWAETPIRVRFSWTKTKTVTPRWEQAFSADDGASWEVNWIMDFTRNA